MFCGNNNGCFWIIILLLLFMCGGLGNGCGCNTCNSCDSSCNTCC